MASTGMPRRSDSALASGWALSMRPPVSCDGVNVNTSLSGQSAPGVIGNATCGPTSLPVVAPGSVLEGVPASVDAVVAPTSVDAVVAPGSVDAVVAPGSVDAVATNTLPVASVV